MFTTCGLSVYGDCVVCVSFVELEKVSGVLGTPYGVSSTKIFMHVAFVSAPRTRRFEESRPLSQRELLILKSSMTVSITLITHGKISETDDNLEIQSVESSDEEVEDHEDLNVQSVGPKYIPEASMEWQSQTL
ncbi:hypothetical protein JTB14_007979 [Gonioctena quinquepunctata]|nr:hypothetical protein JTB14_007979 [Gonioctena quinquepunctata]